MDKYKITNKLRLEHILQAIEKIEHYCKSADLNKFLENEILHDAILHQFMIIGEAISNIDNDILYKYNYPWHLPRSFRNFIAHEYFGINLEKVWNTVNIDIPVLKKAIKNIIEKEF
jgi:uncharacterized protein with HEPN domain